jgi:3-deoxy-D-manno-octulosonic acid kinase
MLNAYVNADIKAIKRPEGTYAIVQDSALPFTFDPAQFNPSGYGHAQAIVGKGGRGSAWMVDTPAGIGVLKHYRRGGWAAKISPDRYIYHGAGASRSHCEFRLLTRLRTLGLPVPEPMAAFCLSHYGLYRAALLTHRIPNAQSLVEAVSGRDAPWAAIGGTLAGFHKAFVRHADLNANNILIEADQSVNFIDWDKGRIENNAVEWPEAVLARLIRSLRKETSNANLEYLESGIDALSNAYRGSMT